MFSSSDKTEIDGLFLILSYGFRVNEPEHVVFYAFEFPLLLLFYSLGKGANASEKQYNYKHVKGDPTGSHMTELLFF